MEKEGEPVSRVTRCLSRISMSVVNNKLLRYEKKQIVEQVEKEPRNLAFEGAQILDKDSKQLL